MWPPSLRETIAKVLHRNPELIFGSIHICVESNCSLFPATTPNLFNWILLHLTFKISVKILAESESSCERTLVYRTVYENFVVLIQQRKQDNVWNTYHHCLLPKLLIKAIAAVPEKTDPSECSIITSGGYLPAKVLPAFQDCNMDTLPEEIKRILYRFDCECVPLFENQLGAYQACDDLANLRGISSSPDSPDSESTLSSLPTTPSIDPSRTATPAPSPYLFAGINNNNNNPPNDFDNFDENVLSGTTFQTPKREALSDSFQTLTCSETPNVSGAPKKRRPEKSLMDLFDKNNFN